MIPEEKKAIHDVQEKKNVFLQHKHERKLQIQLFILFFLLPQGKGD